MTSESPLLVVPVRDALWLADSVRSGLVTPRIPIGVERGDDDVPMQRRDSAGLMDVVTSDQGWIAVRSHGGRALQVFKAAGDSLHRANVAMPAELSEIHDMALVGPALFVAGRPRSNPECRLTFCDISRPTPTWLPMPVPDSAVPSATVVKLLCDDHRLLAIDAAFAPKILLEFDLKSPLQPAAARAVRMPSGVDDRIIGAAMGRTFFAVLSASHHQEGKAWKLGIYDRETLDEVATFFKRAGWSDSLNIPTQVVAVDDLFLLAHGMEGVGVIRLQDKSPTRFGHLHGFKPRSTPYLPVEKVPYVTPLGTGRVKNVAVLPNASRALAVVRQGSRTWWETIEF